MKVSTREWVTKAEEDFALVSSLARPRKKPLWGPLAFHAQQCVEKYLKARINEAGGKIQKTHDLDKLLSAVTPLEPLWAAYLNAFQQLTAYAVAARYPGLTLSKIEAMAARKICRAFRRDARSSLGLKP